MYGLFAAAAVAHSAGVYRAEVAAGRASAKASAVRTDLRFLKMDVEKLLMITEALWTVMKEQHGYSEEDLVREVQKIDLRDGKLDGKVAKQEPSACPSCGRTLIGDRPMCLYCGTAIAKHPFKR